MFVWHLERVNVICLPVDEPIRTRNFVDYQPFVAGWGRLQEGGKSSNVLQVGIYISKTETLVWINGFCIAAIASARFGQ